MLSLLFVGVLVMLLALKPAANVPQGAGQDLESILEASGQAMEAVQSLRFSGTGEMSFGAGPPEFAMTLEVSGAYRAPDQFQVWISMDAGEERPFGRAPGNGVVEMILIGDQMWGRMGTQDWETSSLSEMTGGFGPGMVTPTMFSPTTFTRPQTSLGSLLPGATVSDVGGAYRISADADLADLVRRMVPEELAGQMTMTDAFPGPARVRLSLDIGKATLYVERLQFTLSIAPEMVISFTATMSDFNSPSISIEPPR